MKKKKKNQKFKKKFKLNKNQYPLIDSESPFLNSLITLNFNWVIIEKTDTLTSEYTANMKKKIIDLKWVFSKIEDILHPKYAGKCIMMIEMIF